MRIVFDTNVLVRAFPGALGPAREALLLATIDPHRVVVSVEMLREVGEALRYDRLRALHGLDDAAIDESINHLRNSSTIVDPQDSDIVSVVVADPDDDHVIAAAVIGGADVICTLDRHFRHADVQTYCTDRGIRVMSDVELLNELRSATNSADDAS